MAKVNPQGRLWSILEATERREIEDALVKNAGNVRASATYLGIERSRLYKRLVALSIRKEDYQHGTKPSRAPGKAPEAEKPAVTGWLSESPQGDVK